MHARLVFLALSFLLVACGQQDSPSSLDSLVESGAAIESQALTSGVAVAGLSGTGNTWRPFTLVVPSGATGVKIEYSGTGYCGLRYSQEGPPESSVVWSAIQPVGISCAGSESVYNLTPGTLYLALGGYKHTYPLVDGY